MTANLAGYNRVFSCARARATELLAAVCAVGCIGAVIRPQELPGSTSGAAVYLPCDRAFTSTGIAAEFPPIDRHEDRGPMLVVPDVPIARMRALRRTGAEVWPGAWHAATEQRLPPAPVGDAVARRNCGDLPSILVDDEARHSRLEEFDRHASGAQKRDQLPHHFEVGMCAALEPADCPPVPRVLQALGRG